MLTKKESKKQAKRGCKFNFFSSTVRELLPEADILFDELERICIEAQRLLVDEDLETCMVSIYGIATHLLGLMEQAEAPDITKSKKEPLERAVSGLRRPVAELRAFLVRSAIRLSLVDYFLGMAWGIVFVIAVFGVLVLFARDASLLASIVAGGFGALVSVMTRVQTGNLKVNYEAGRRLLLMLGAFRPLIGAIMGVGFYLLISGGIVPLAVPTEPRAMSYFYPGVAFLAGFSERFAQDMLVRTERRLTALGARDEEGVPETGTSEQENR